MLALLSQRLPPPQRDGILEEAVTAAGKDVDALVSVAVRGINSARSPAILDLALRRSLALPRKTGSALQPTPPRADALQKLAPLMTAAHLRAVFETEQVIPDHGWRARCLFYISTLGPTPKRLPCGSQPARILVPSFPGSNPATPASQLSLCGVISTGGGTLDIPAG